jgi:hypothetical protein
MNEKKISRRFIWIMLILLLAGCGNPTPEPTPIAPTATDTPILSTATPTFTSTATSTNTATPTSSPTATGTVAAGSPYLDEVSVNLQEYQNALANASNYVKAPTTDFNVLLDEDWKQNAGNALNQLDEAAKQLEGIDNAPPEQEQLDMQLKMIASETHELVDNFGSGMNQLDLGAINSAINNIGNITSYINNATAELDKHNNP